MTSHETPPRLIATDLDGTLVRDDHTISPRTIAAVRRVMDRDVEVVFVTGRPPRKMTGIIESFGGYGTAICSNGAIVYDPHTGQCAAGRFIAPEIVAEAARLLRALIPGIGIAVEYAHELAADPWYEPWEWDADVTVRRESDETLFSRPAPKLLGRHPTLSPDELVDLAAPKLSGLVSVYHSNGSRLLEAIAPGVSKAAALAALAEQRDISAAEVAAFGDMPNDLPMLAWAGRSYAVANAHSSVLAAVDEVIGSNDEDAVAQVLDRYFPAGPVTSHSKEDSVHG
jgi:hypothetical protein